MEVEQQCPMGIVWTCKICSQPIGNYDYSKWRARSFKIFMPANYDEYVLCNIFLKNIFCFYFIFFKLYTCIYHRFFNYFHLGLLPCSALSFQGTPK
jgi:hypothetical protein